MDLGNEALVELDFSGVAQGDPPQSVAQTPIKSIEVKLKSNEAVAELAVSALRRSLWWITECNSSAKSTSRLASLPRR